MIKSMNLLLLAGSLAATSALMAAEPLTDREIDRLIGRMTLEEKARLLVGAPGCEDSLSHRTEGAAGWTCALPELGIPSINLADGPVGVRIDPVPSAAAQVVYDEAGVPVATLAGETVEGAPTRYCTCFPSTTALAATWDSGAARLQGEAMGREARAYGIDVILTPGINIMRNPLCGRNFEYYSEDPLLTGHLAAAVIEGIQSQGVGTSLKHFVANNQQTGKKVNDARMTQRALREIYLRAFEYCVRKAKPWSVMGSYNRIAGEYTQTNRELMIDLLRDEWGFDGLVLTDWTVRRPTAGLLEARSALIMPGDEEIVREIVEAVQSGAVRESVLDACVRDVLRVVFRSLTAQGWSPSTPDLGAHAALSREIADESMVLLKNTGETLPLKTQQRIALFGATAYKSIAGGTGSSNVNKAYVRDICDGLRDAGFTLDERLRSLYEKYVAYQNEALDRYPDCPAWQKISYHRTVLPEMDLSGNPELIDRQVGACDAAVVVLGRGSGETSDRVVEGDFNLTAAERFLLERVAEACRRAGKRMVVVMNVCGVVETASWRELPDAILLAWFPGQECGDAVADLLTGRVSPSGRLPMTFPLCYEDLPSSKNYPHVGQTEGRNFDYTLYEEDIWVGYRYFTTARREVSYPFGYGLSYTSFEYDDPEIRRRGQGWELSVTVRNTGRRAGREVVQLYVEAPEAEYAKPESELRAFAKTGLLQPGGEERVTLRFTDYDLASFDQARSQWRTDRGSYVARLGRSAEETILTVPFRSGSSRSWRVRDLLAPAGPITPIQVEQAR